MDEYTICIEAFVRWEQMTGRSFQRINFEDAADLHKLLYCAYIINRPFSTTFERFETALLSNKRLYKRAINQLSHYNSVSTQFSVLKQAPTIEPDDDTVDAPIFLGDVTARLVIMGGMDARYVMREMSIEDMMRYVRALDEKQKQENEAARLWTYLSILPHVDKNKLPSPQRLITFPWETEAIRAEAERVAEASREEFEKFMRGE